MSLAEPRAWQALPTPSRVRQQLHTPGRSSASALCAPAALQLATSSESPERRPAKREALLESLILMDLF
eukprot:3578007-Pyramimonas_sp.AAC.1